MYRFASNGDETCTLPAQEVQQQLQCVTLAASCLQTARSTARATALVPRDVVVAQCLERDSVSLTPAAERQRVACQLADVADRILPDDQRFDERTKVRCR
jgi:hypothetical protein